MVELTPFFSSNPKWMNPYLEIDLCQLKTLDDLQNCHKNEQEQIVLSLESFLNTCLLPYAVHHLCELQIKDPSLDFLLQPLIGGRYRRLARLSYGSYGIVYKVERVSDQSIFAEKFFFDGNDYNELDISMRFDHPNIVSSVDFFFHFNQQLSIIYPLYPRCLYRTEKRSLTLEERKKIVFQILNTVKFMHDNGYFHGDLKPGNIFLDEYNNPILGDFGATNRLDFTEPSWCGTPFYAPPQGLQRSIKNQHAIYHESLNQKQADIFCLGILIAEFLMQNDGHIFRWLSNHTLAYDDYIKNYKSYILFQLNDVVLFDLVLRSCHPSQKERYESIDQMIAHNYFASERDGYIVEEGTIEYTEFVPLFAVENLMEIQVISSTLNHMFETHHCHMQYCYFVLALFYRATTILDFSATFSMRAAAVCILARDLFPQKLFDNDIFAIFQLERQEVYGCIPELVFKLNGKLRSKTLYDYTASFDELKYGLKHVGKPEAIHARWNEFLNINPSKRRRLSI